MQEVLVVTQEVEDVLINEQEKTVEDLSEQEDLKDICVKYGSAIQQIIHEQDQVIHLLEEIVSSGKHLGGMLSLSERNSIREEVDKAKQQFNLHIRAGKSSSDIRHIFHPKLFKNLLIGIRANCPTITNILEQLVLSSNTSRNTVKTENFKMKAAVHLLASLLDVRDQHDGIPLLFGLLCMCYGAGPAMIRILQ